MGKQFNLPFISRLFVGSIFVYSGIYKIITPESFDKTLHAYNFFSNSITDFIALVFPWAQLILGLLLISGHLEKYVATIISVLLLIFIIMIIIKISKGSCQACGFLSESLFYKGGNPFILITANYLLFILSVLIIISKITFLKKILFSSFKQIILFLSLLVVVFIILILFASSGISSYERNYISLASKEKNKIIQELSRYKNLEGTDLRSISNITFPINPNTRIIVILTLHSLDCGNCVDEAIYLEYLNAKYGKNICFYGVVWKIGKTAINNFKNKFSITYPIIENPDLLDYKIFSRFKSLKIIASPDYKILRIDPITFNVRKFRDNYENILLSYLK